MPMDNIGKILGKSYKNYFHSATVMYSN